MFVARDRELGQLDGFLDRALTGQGQVCFVTGGAGSSKTALVIEFARRAQERHGDLVVAVGQSDAQTGAGDAYLPFRVYLTCYLVLRADQDPRAQALLATAHSLLQDQAARIEDETLRRSFLENVPAQREIVREFSRTQ